MFSTGGVQTTSDSREKTIPEGLPDDLLDAWGEVNALAWKWLKSVSEKGDSARKQIGPIAQHIRDAFVRHGIMQLGSTNYPFGVLNYDEWESKPAVIGVKRLGRVVLKYAQDTVIADSVEFSEDFEESGGVWQFTHEEKLVIEPAQEAGNRWSIRADQCLFLEAAYQRREMNFLKKRIEMIELK